MLMLTFHWKHHCAFWKIWDRSCLGKDPLWNPWLRVIVNVCDKNTYRLILELFILRLVHSQALGGSRPSALTVKKTATVSIFAESVYVCLFHWNYSMTCQPEWGKSHEHIFLFEHPLLSAFFIFQASQSLVYENKMGALQSLVILILCEVEKKLKLTQCANWNKIDSFFLWGVSNLHCSKK